MKTNFNTNVSTLRIRNQLEEMQLIQHNVGLRAATLSAPVLRSLLNYLPPRERKEASLSVYIQTECSVSLYLSMRGLKSFKKDKRLLRALEYVTSPEHGPWDSERCADYAYGGVPNRDFAFVRKVEVPLPASLRSPGAKHHRWLCEHGHMARDQRTLTCTLTLTISAYAEADTATCIVKQVEEPHTYVVRRTEIVCA